jgi:hypothetical protein
VSFRKQSKRMVRVLVPDAIEDEIRERSKRRSLSEVATELMCLGLKIDPRSYGIEPTEPKTRRKAKATATAS